MKRRAGQVFFDLSCPSEHQPSSKFFIKRFLKVLCGISGKDNNTKNSNSTQIDYYIVFLKKFTKNLKLV